MRKFSILLALLAGTMLPLTAVAQDSAKSSSSSKKSKGKSSKKDSPKEASSETPAIAAPAPKEATFSSEQIHLNNQAVDATSAGEFKKAEQIFHAMISIGEFNIIWLNLAKTYMNEDKCMEAADALKKVYTAPRISDIPHEKVEERAEAYAQQLAEKCSSRIVLTCNPSEMTVSIDGGQEIPCSSEPISLVPGRHVVYGQTSFGFNTVVANSVANETTEVKVDVIDYETVAKDAGVTPEELRKKSTLFKALGYSFIGVGTAALGSGVGLVAYYYFDYKDKYKLNTQQKITSEDLRKIKQNAEKYMNAGYVLSAVGGSMLVAGIALVIVDAVKFKPQLDMLESLSFQVSPVVSPEFSGFSFSTTF